MYKIICLLFAVISSCLVSAQPSCGSFKLSGYKHGDTLTRVQALSLIASPFVAKDNCGNKIKNRSGYLVVTNNKKELLIETRFNGAISADKREQVFSKLQPGNIMQFQEFKFGDENKFIANLSFTIKAP